MSHNHRQHRMTVTHAIIKIVVDRNKSMGGAAYASKIVNGIFSIAASFIY